MMQLKPVPKPQFHSSKCHQTYNGSKVLPVNVWVRSPTVHEVEHGEYVLLYEIVLFYRHNRACVIYRDWDDLQRLKRTMGLWKGATTFSTPCDALGMQRFIRQAIIKQPRDCALEYFLRRRMDDCAGR